MHDLIKAVDAFLTDDLLREIIHGDIEYRINSITKDDVEKVGDPVVFHVTFKRANSEE